MSRIHVKSSAREELIDITEKVRALVRASGTSTGGCLPLVAAHDMRSDRERGSGSGCPQGHRRLHEAHRAGADAAFRHAEGNSDSHIKTSLFGPGLTLLIEDGNLVLGTWQHVFLAEWDGPRTREIVLQVLPASASA